MRYAYCTLQNLLKILNFSLSSPVRRLDQPQVSGGLGEH